MSFILGLGFLDTFLYLLLILAWQLLRLHVFSLLSFCCDLPRKTSRAGNCKFQVLCSEFIMVYK